MATGSVSVTITIPTLNLGADPGGRASGAIVATLLEQVIEAVKGAGATSGNLIYPPGSATVAGTFTYSPAT